MVFSPHAKLRGLRWRMIGLIMLGSLINYLTRSTLAVAVLWTVVRERTPQGAAA